MLDGSAHGTDARTSIGYMTKKNRMDPTALKFSKQGNGLGKGSAAGMRGRTAMPFKATGHKGGISRQGSRRG